MNRSKKSLFTWLALAMLVLALPMFGQSRTAGALSGTVEDESGAALPGVTVELSGPAMQGTRTSVTDGQGRYRFSNVPPGEAYRVSATLDGFQTASRSGFRVSLGQEGQITLVLRTSLSETITVTADAPLVDVTQTTAGVNVTAAQFENLPSQRSFQQLTTIAPGVTMEMGDSRPALANSPNVGAASAPENNYIIDGISTTDPRYGVSGMNVTMNMVEEVQVMTGGYPAEFGRSTGGVFNVITKSGGNEFHGDAFAYYRDADWTDARARLATKGTITESNVQTNQDFGFALGGPIVRDRLWFFGAYNPSNRDTQIGRIINEDGTIDTTATDFETESVFYAAKLTWGATPNHNFVLSANGDPTEQTGWIGPAFSEAGAAIRETDTGSHSEILRYTGVLTQSWLAEASIGQYERNNKLAPGTDVGRNVPRQVDNTIGGYQRGGFQRTADDTSGRDSYFLKSSNMLGSHELRYGIDVEENWYDADLAETWYNYFGTTTAATMSGPCGPAAGVACARIEERSYFVQGAGETENTAFFAQDSWKVLPNLQLNLGVRYEEQKMNSARGVYTARNEDEVHDPVAAGSYTLDDNWAPRLGIIYDPLNNGRSKLYGFWGRFYEAIPLDINIRALNGEDYILRDWQYNAGANPNWFNPSGVPVSTAGGWTNYRSRELTAATLTPIDADLKAQYQDEWMLGGDYQFAPLWSAGIRYNQKEIGRVIEDFGTFGDPEDANHLTGYVIGNPGEGFFGAPYDAPNREYQAIDLTLQRAFANNWQLFASYVYAKAEGNYEGLYMSGYEQLDPNITALYDIPSFLANSNGKLRADKPYVFKVHSSYTFPFGLTVSEGFHYSAGVPISAQGPEIYNGYSDGTIFLKPRGSEGRTDDYWSLDLHADYKLPFLSNNQGGLSLIVDVFNVFDNDEVLEVDQDYIYEGMDEEIFSLWSADSNLDDFGNPKFNSTLPSSPYYKTPILYQAPRTVQLGVKYSF